ncbi:MAG: PQQ-like beta-propeller repeat protein [Myxococcaceae bacterium]|nr:PQQ-like beta-propeller repeat protein [Myxococcaceae bacterium]
MTWTMDPEGKRILEAAFAALLAGDGEGFRKRNAELKSLRLKEGSEYLRRVAAAAWAHEVVFHFRQLAWFAKFDASAELLETRDAALDALEAPFEYERWPALVFPVRPPKAPPIVFDTTLKEKPPEVVKAELARLSRLDQVHGSGLNGCFHTLFPKQPRPPGIPLRVKDLTANLMNLMSYPPTAIRPVSPRYAQVLRLYLSQYGEEYSAERIAWLAELGLERPAYAPRLDPSTVFTISATGTIEGPTRVSSGAAEGPARAAPAVQRPASPAPHAPPPRDVPAAKAPAPRPASAVASPVELPLTGRLLVDFRTREVQFAGDTDDGWFVSQRHEPDLLLLDQGGSLLERFPCPRVDRVAKVGLQLVGLKWPSAWGHWFEAGSAPGVGYDARTGQTLWTMAGGLHALVGERHALGAPETATPTTAVLFELTTGEQRWSVNASKPTVASDEEHVFLSEQDGTFRALDLRTGAERWKVSARSDRRPASAVKRPFVSTRQGLWYPVPAGRERSLLVCLSRETGSTIAEVPFDGAIVDLAASGDRLLIFHQFGMATLIGGTVSPGLDGVSTGWASFDGQGFALYDLQTRRLLWGTDPVGRTFGATLSTPWNGLRTSGGFATLWGQSEFLRWPLTGRDTEGAIEAPRVLPRLDRGGALEDARVVFGGPSMLIVEHATRGRFTLTVPDTGLAPGAAIQLGGFITGPGGQPTPSVVAYVAPDGTPIRTEVGAAGRGAAREERGRVEVGRALTNTKAQPPESFVALVSALTAAGLLPPLLDAEITRLHALLAPIDELGDCLTAELLQAAHEGRTGLEHGYLSHDHRFGNETDDVIAEFARCLPGEPIAFKQLEFARTSIHVSTTIDGQETTEWVDFKEEGLDAIAHFINRKLAAAGAARRVIPLQTGGDWLPYIVRTPAEVAALKARGVPGLL